MVLANFGWRVATGARPVVDGGKIMMQTVELTMPGETTPALSINATAAGVRQLWVVAQRVGAQRVTVRPYVGPLDWPGEGECPVSVYA